LVLRCYFERRERPDAYAGDDAAPGVVSLVRIGRVKVGAAEFEPDAARVTLGRRCGRALC
jgi:hypothetical protein